MQLVGRNRERGATISEILEGVNSLNNSDKKDDFVSTSTIVTAVAATRSSQYALCNPQARSSFLQ